MCAKPVEASAVRSCRSCGRARAAGLQPAARSDTHYELWPEIDAYYGINTRTRLLFTASSTRANGEGSQRYRVRLGAEGGTKVCGYVIAPYGHAELFYDTRYSTWRKQ
jgi:hypothetical protein